MVSEDEVNQLLAALSPEEFERIWPHLSELDIPVGHVLFNPGISFETSTFRLQRLSR